MLMFQLISSIIVIPLISSLIKYCHENSYNSNWQVLTFIIVVPIFSTFLLNFALVLTNNPKIIAPFKTIKPYKYFQIFDYLCKYAYAFLSGYELFWGCFGVELGFLIAVCFVRPYKKISRFALNIGEPVVVILSLLLGKFVKGQFSLAVSIVLLFVAISPVIISLYLYFIFDFGPAEQIEKETINSFVMDLLIIFLTVIGFLLFGLAISSIYQLNIII